ncbi:GSCFA domain-containing protein [Hymenobacter elongatus]|uniref:GSCFA domain-containing protein n=1 Tax=Hymenobacter elongatus TaxID=877208 RepID=A0A4Z0PKP3_9BACT|nr:GSCFA domain-containing protein [Hymenobacter elongatus]TGE16242.1 hypothetical protein E5J99_10180 [Hymenobacter elongatus]
MFRTELPLTPHPQQLPLSAQVLTVGSCFSDTIGSRLAAAKVKTLVNPFGTVFNPLSVCQLLRAAAGEDMDWQQHLVEARGRWQSYDLHATIGADSPVVLLQQIQELVQEVGTFLETTDVVMLTLGTAYAYRLHETEEVVNNCHKIPADRFEKVLLTPDEIINAVAETHAFLRLRNPKLRFILTVSPVRHLKDTLPLNSVSKSVLRVACHYLSELLPDVSYFPAYELLVDDLRDYRFYASDMLHPSETAETYIWERFTRTYFDSAFGRFRKEWDAVRLALGHRPLYAAAPEHREFLETTLTRLHRLASQTDVALEIQAIEQQLADLPLPKPVPTPELEPDDDEERIDVGEPAERKATVAATDSAAAVVRPVVVVEPAAEPEELEALEDSEEQEDAEDVQDDASSAQPKRKRRSRGGAKRTARKKAAQQHALLEAEAAASTEPAAETVSAEPTGTPLDEPEAEVISAAAPAAEPVEATIPELQVEAEAERAPAPTQVVATQASAPAIREPNIDWLQTMDEEEDKPVSKRRSPKAPTPSKASRVAPEKKPRATKARVITTPPRTSRKKLPALYAEAAAPAEAAATAAVVPVATEAVPVVLVPAPSTKAVSPVPAASTAAIAPAAEASEAATPAPEPLEPAAAQPAPVAPPKKRVRPPRKKPAATDQTPPTT